MNATRLLLAAFLLVAFLSDGFARESRSDSFLRVVQITPGLPEGDVPVSSASFVRTRLDTIWFGGHDGNGYAVEGGFWDFDDGTLQGWYGVDQTQNTGDTWGKWVTAQHFECIDSAPMINGTAGQIWFGRQQEAADAGCWVCDAGLQCSLGYENDLCQRIDSPPVAYSGGDLTVEFLYFLDCEGFPYDNVSVQILALAAGESLDVVTLRDVDEGVGGIIGDPDNPAVFTDTLVASQLPVPTDHIQVRFEFVADGGWSDEDMGGGVCSTYGPFGADNVTVSESGVGELASYSFDEDDEGWTASHCPGVGDFVGVHPVSIYDILDPCQCNLSGYVLGMHDENLEHPGDPDGSGGGQDGWAVSPIVDKSDYLPDFNNVFTEYDVYEWLPLHNGVLYSIRWGYYPWTCPQTGGLGWKILPPGPMFFPGSNPVCYRTSNNGTEDGLPPDAQLVRVVIALISCCACLGIEDCTGITNETPLFDNIRIGISHYPDAPVVYLDGWGFQDGFSQEGDLSSTSTGRSDDAQVDAATQPPFVLDDSLTILGPVVAGDTPSWEAHLWFKVSRKGPGQDAIPGYSDWKDQCALASFPGNPEAQFVGVRMDSVILDPNISFPNKYCSFAHPDDGFYINALDQRDDRNEILQDNVFTPGTQIHYFITANFMGNPERYFLPDTTEGNFYEYEILPSMRLDTSAQNVVWPCVLYWDAFNRGAQQFIEPALDAVLPEVPGSGPNHDRYDELGASSNFNGSSIYRLGVGANNGATLVQLLGYRAIILNTGDFSPGAMEVSDFIGLEDWLKTTICFGNENRQGLLANGDEAAGIIEEHRPSLLSESLGAGLECSPYREQDCPPGTASDSSFCVKVIDAAGAYPPQGDYYAFGNGCPQVYTYSVLSQAGGVGNRAWFDYDAPPPPQGKGVVNYAQVAIDRSQTLANYRAVIEGYSYHHVTTTFDDGADECAADSAGRVSAAGDELIAALEWIFDGTGVPSFCVDPCYSSDGPEVDATEARVNRLYQNTPNPFNPRTTIRFSLARRGPVQLLIYDVGGRLVRTLLDERRDEGLHSIVWDGTDNARHKVGSGVYWSQLKTGDYISNKKIVLLR